MQAVEDDIESRLEAADGRDEEICILVDANWKFIEVAQALDVTRAVVAGVAFRRKNKRKKAA